MIDCSVIVVSWNVAPLLERCLASLAAQSGPTTEVIVVDNASADGSPALVRERFPTALLIETGANLGYAGGVNAGLAAARGRWALVLNPDTELAPDALATLLAWGDAHPEVAVIGPRLVFGDGSPQSSRRRWPTPATFFWESTLLERWRPANAAARRYRMDDAPAAGPQQVDWLVGAALLVRMDAIAAVGGMDTRYWMYSEELEWQRRLSACGQIWYLPTATITHHEGRSSSQVPARKHIAFQASKLRYANQHHGPLLATALHLFLAASYALEWATEAAKWLLGHRRELRRERLAVYSAVLRSLMPGGQR